MGFELLPPRLYWVSLTELSYKLARREQEKFISLVLGFGFFFQSFAVFNAAHTICENACTTSNLSNCFMQI